MKIELENVKPRDIERRSFEIITEELGDRKLDPDKELIIKRCIHTSADFEYADSLCFSDNVVAKAMDAIRQGACIVTDTQMGRSGINKRALARYGGEVYCFMSDEDVAATAKRRISAVSSPERKTEKKRRFIFIMCVITRNATKKLAPRQSLIRQVFLQ